MSINTSPNSIADLQAASDKVWEDLKHGVDLAWTVFRESLDKAMFRFN